MDDESIMRWGFNAGLGVAAGALRKLADQYAKPTPGDLKRLADTIEFGDHTAAVNEMRKALKISRGTDGGTNG